MAWQSGLVDPGPLNPVAVKALERLLETGRSIMRRIWRRAAESGTRDDMVLQGNAALGDGEDRR